jgi:hypothetical protein
VDESVEAGVYGHRIKQAHQEMGVSFLIHPLSGRSNPLTSKLEEWRGLIVFENGIRPSLEAVAEDREMRNGKTLLGFDFPVRHFLSVGGRNFQTPSIRADSPI